MRGRDDCVRDADVGSRDASRHIWRRGEGVPQRHGYELFNPKNGGYFVWNFDKDQFCWNAGWDSKKVYEVCYDATPDGDNYKLKNKDSTGQYTVELAIDPHDGNFLKFTCKDSSDQLYADC